MTLLEIEGKQTVKQSYRILLISIAVEKIDGRSK